MGLGSRVEGLGRVVWGLYRDYGGSMQEVYREYMRIPGGAYRDYMWTRWGLCRDYMDIL